MHTSEDVARFDGLFTAIAEGTQGIQPLMEAFFSFLARKTDFYDASLPLSSLKTKQAGEDPSKKVVMACYEKYRQVAATRLENERQRSARAHEEAARRRAAEARDSEDKALEAFRRRQDELKRGPVVEEILDEPIPNSVNYAEANKDEDAGPPPVGNGGTTDTYTWTQTLSSLDVYVRVPSGTKARDCQVKLQPQAITLTVGGQKLLDGAFHDRIKLEDSYWTLEDGKEIHLMLEKAEGMKWWSCVIEGDAAIDTRKIIPENSKLSDLDPELRQTVEKMMFDQQQKARGLPTSDELKRHELLEKFKQAHPEMDFSNAKINAPWGAQNNSFSLS